MKSKSRALIQKIISEELSSSGISAARDSIAASRQPQPEKTDLSKVKVKTFFNKLQKNEGLMQYLDFRNPVEQAEAIIKFASLVGVPTGKIPAIIASFRQLNAPTKK